VISKPSNFSKLLVIPIAGLSMIASVLAAAPAAIGIITASGHFLIERSQVWGNSTLFDGARIETSSASSDLALRNGVRLQLGASSRAQVWENRLALERGIGQAAGPASFELDAAGLKIRAANGTARFRVALADQGGIQVVALSGEARVTNAAGLLLASVPAGRSMSFSPQAGSGGQATRTGCLLYKEGHFIIQDDETQEIAELNGRDQVGRDLASNTGSRVEAVGTLGATKPAVSIATTLINVSKVTQRSQGGCLSTAAALNAQTEAPSATAAAGNTPAVTQPSTGGGGLSTGAKVGIIAAIGAGAGIGAALALAGHKSSTSQ
jgi:hypothetical protein